MSVGRKRVMESTFVTKPSCANWKESTKIQIRPRDGRLWRDQAANPQPHPPSPRRKTGAVLPNRPQRPPCQTSASDALGWRRRHSAAQTRWRRPCCLGEKNSHRSPAVVMGSRPMAARATPSEVTRPRRWAAAPRPRHCSTWDSPEATSRLGWLAQWIRLSPRLAAPSNRPAYVSALREPPETVHYYCMMRAIWESTGICYIKIFNFKHKIMNNIIMNNIFISAEISKFCI